MNPGGHGVFDFVHRDPKTYLPISSDHARGARLGRPRCSATTCHRRQDAAQHARRRAWDPLLKAGVDAVSACRAIYPPTPSDARCGRHGTIDRHARRLRRYTWFTTYPVQGRDHLKGDIEQVSLSDDDLDGQPDTVHATLKGPPDLFHLPPAAAERRRLLDGAGDVPHRSRGRRGADRGGRQPRGAARR
jgi:hypothetical protein